MLKNIYVVVWHAVLHALYSLLMCLASTQGLTDVNWATWTALEIWEITLKLDKGAKDTEYWFWQRNSLV